jgi:fumarate reductase flavoprotein subunit
MKPTEDCQDRNTNETGTTAATPTRRRFLRTLGAAGAAVAGAPAAMNLLNAKAEAAAVRAVPRQWNETVDVLIVGSGFAGLCAAIEATSRGSKVLILEKMPIMGGNSIISGGGYNSWTDKLNLREKLKLGDDSVALHTVDTLKGGDYYNIPELVKIFVEGAPATLNWMIDEGDLKLRPILSRIGGHSAFRGHTTMDGTGRGFIDVLQKISAKYGVAPIRMNTKVTWIWRQDPATPVLGVEVQTQRATRNIRINKALILAAGGFGRDIKMRQMFNPNITAAYNCTNQPGATGEVLRCAQAVGADALQMAFIQLYPTADPESGVLDLYALYPGRAPMFGGLFVDVKGKRFVNEMERRDVVARAEIATGAKRAFSVFTAKMIPHITMPEEVSQGVEAGRVWKAGSLAELAKKMDVPAAALQETIAKHNEYLRAGKDPEFSKPFTSHMLAIDEGPFYALAQWPAVHHCMGGLRINTAAQVMDIWGDPIPKLYAAGEVAGGVHGANRLGGNAIPTAMVFGRIAGTNAAKEKV